MSWPIRLVAPYRPFPPESDWHRENVAFDWIAAIRMLSASAVRVGHDPLQVLTDVDTALPFPCLSYHTQQRRLMLWYLEIAACYLASADFDRDTVALDSDQLIYRALAPWCDNDAVDLTILIRPDLERDGTKNLPILNGVQFWHVRGRTRLAAFYQEALALACALPEDRIVWGADTDALETLLAPLTVGVHDRAGLRVRLIDSRTILETMSSTKMRWLTQSSPPRWRPQRAVLDFRGRRKQFMAPVYRETVMVGAGA